MTATVVKGSTGGSWEGLTTTLVSAQLMEVSVDDDRHNGEVTNFVLLTKMVKGIVEDRILISHLVITHFAQWHSCHKNDM